MTGSDSIDQQVNPTKRSDATASIDHTPSGYVDAMAEETTVAAGSWKERISRRVERARFDAGVQLDHLFLVDGHTLNVAGTVAERLVEGPAVLVVSPDPEPSDRALRTPLLIGRSRSSDTLVFSSHLDLAPLFTATAATDRPPTLSVWVEGLRGGPHAATLADHVATGRNDEIMRAVPPARDLGLQFSVDHDDLRRVNIAVKRLTPGWFLLRTDIVGTDLIALCRPSPLGAVIDTVAAVGPDNVPSIPCHVEPSGDNVAVHIDLVALSEATALGRTSTWTLRAAAEGAKSTAVGRARSDLVTPTDLTREARTNITLPDRRLSVTLRATQRASLAIELRHRPPRSASPTEESAPS
jgi:hypothetical protein